MVLLDGPCAVNDEAHARRESSTRNTESSTSHEHGTRTTDTTADPSLSTRRREPQPNSAVAVTGSRRTWSDRLVLSQGRGTLERTRVPVRCRAAPRRAPPFSPLSSNVDQSTSSRRKRVTGGSFDLLPGKCLAFFQPSFFKI